MSNNLCTKTDFAKRCGVGLPAVIKSLNTCLHGVLYGNLIDADHPRAIAYYEYQQNKKTNFYANRSYWDIVRLIRENPEITPDQILNTLGKNIRDIKQIYELAKIETLSPPNQSLGNKQKERINARAPARTRDDEPRVQQQKKDDVFLIEIEKSRRKPAQKITPNMIPEDINDLKRLTIDEILEIFGTDLKFKLYVDAIKNLELINEKRLKNARTMGKLVSRELVKVGIIDRINAAHIKLLTDAAKTITVRATAMVHAGRDQKEIQELVIDVMSSQIKPMKEKIDMAYKNIEKLTNL